MLSVARASLLNSHSDVFGNRIDRKICKNLPKLRSIKKNSRQRNLDTTIFLFRVSFFFFHSPVFFLSLVFLSFFFKATHYWTLFCIIIDNNGEFCEKRNKAGCFERNRRNFWKAVKKRSRQRKAFVRETIRIYNSTIIISRIQVKDERGGPETVGSDDQGKSPRLLCVLCCS